MDLFTRNSPYYHLLNIYYSSWNTLDIYRLLCGCTVSEKLPKIPLGGPPLIHQSRLLGFRQYPRSGVLLTWGTENSLAGINLENTGMTKGCNFVFCVKNRQTQLCGRAHYRATRKNLESKTRLDQPAECASGDDPLLLYKILLSFLMRFDGHFWPNYQQQQWLPQFESILDGHLSRRHLPAPFRLEIETTI